MGDIVVMVVSTCLRRTCVAGESHRVNRVVLLSCAVAGRVVAVVSTDH